MTVLDFVVESLSSADEGVDGRGNPLDFHLDMADLEEVSRLPLSELNNQVSEMKASLSGAERELQMLKQDAGAKDFMLPTPPGRKLPVLTAVTKSTKNAASSDPRANLVAMLRKRNESNNCEEASAATAPERESQPTTPDDAGAVGKPTEDPRTNLMAMLRKRNGSENCEEASAATAPERKSQPMTPDDASANDKPTEDPRVNLMAMLRKRSMPSADGHDRKAEPTPTIEAGSSIFPNGNDRKSQASFEAARAARASVAACDAARATASVLEQFIGGARARIGDVDNAAGEVRTAAEELALFFGDKKQDISQIFNCLLQFAVMVREAREKATKRAKDEAREKEKLEEAARLLAKKKAAASSLGDLEAASPATGGSGSARSVETPRSAAPPMMDIFDS
jgi:hypothetical protein